MLDICLQSNTDHARLFIERVVAYAGCDIASEQFRSDVIDRLKKAAKVCTANASGAFPKQVLAFTGKRASRIYLHWVLGRTIAASYVRLLLTLEDVLTSSHLHPLTIAYFTP